jgi:hypothetical protein
MAPVLKKYGLKRVPHTTRFDSASLRTTLEFLLEASPTGKSVGTDLIKMGLAVPGTEVLVRWSDGADYVGTIIKNGRSKYVVEFAGEEGKYWRVPYANCSALTA